MIIRRNNIGGALLLQVLFFSLIQSETTTNAKEHSLHSVKLGNFHNVPSLDPVSIATNFDDGKDEGDGDTTVTTTTTLIMTTENAIEDETEATIQPRMQTASIDEEERTTEEEEEEEDEEDEEEDEDEDENEEDEETTIDDEEDTTEEDNSSEEDQDTIIATTSTDPIYIISAASYQQQQQQQQTTIPTIITATNNSPQLSSTTSSSHHSLNPTNTASPNTTIQYTNTSDPLVQYDLECKADDVFCAKVSKAVGSAIDEFARVINVKNSLLIKVAYYSFCDKTCANDTYGWGSPTSQFTLPFEDGADLNYVYPQALAKQLAPYSSTSVWSKYDIEIEINHDVYVNATDIEQALNDGWNGSGTPPNGIYWFFVRDVHI